jgi:cobalt-zinc-cadmium efflux system protein
MGHEHSHGHGHAHGARAGVRHAGRLKAAFAVIVGYLILQVVVALTTRSLALLSDAGHMATDALGLGMALAAISVADRPARHRHRTFGLYRLEILAALTNAVMLVGVAGYVALEAVRRLGEPPEIDPVPVLVVGLGGLAVNVGAFWLLRPGAEESLNVEGAYLEVVADLVGSIGVVLAAVLWWVTGWGWVDAVVGAAIGLFILPRALRLGQRALRVLVQAAPPHLSVDAIEADLSAIPGVVDVHDLHVWTLTSEMDVLTAHLMVGGDVDTHGVLDQAREVLSERHGVAHATLQIEPDTHEGCERVDW